jgi:soluble lytic murein transglycosylase-like protein
MRVKTLVFLSCMFFIGNCAAPSGAVADVYGYRDADGVLHLSNVRPGNGRYQRVMRGNGTAPGARAVKVSQWKSVDLANLPRWQQRRASLRPIRNSRYDGLVKRCAQKYRVEEALVRAVIHAESAFNASAVSHAGAAGLMQLMPATAKRYGVEDRFNASQNVHGGIRYLKDLLNKYQQDERLALAAYNAGEGAVARYKGVPPYAETRAYVKKVIALRGRYRQLE